LVEFFSISSFGWPESAVRGSVLNEKDIVFLIEKILCHWYRTYAEGQ